MRDIGKNIRQLRVNNKMTQDELAEKLFVTRQTVSNYETGKSRPDIDMLVRMSELLDCDVNSILYGIVQQTDRRKEVQGFCLGLTACVITAIPLTFWDSAHKLWTRSFAGPKIALQFVVLPLFLLVLGWTFMQGLRLLTKSKPVQFSLGKFIFWFCISFSIIYFSTILPLIYHQLKHYFAEIYISGLSGPKGWSSGFSYTWPFLSKFFGNLWLFMINRQWIFFFVGILIWLFKEPHLSAKVKIVLPIATLLLSVLLYFTGSSEIKLSVENPDELTNVPYGIQVEQWVEENPPA